MILEAIGSFLTLSTFIDFRFVKYKLFGWKGSRF